MAMFFAYDLYPYLIYVTDSHVSTAYIQDEALRSLSSFDAHFHSDGIFQFDEETSSNLS